MINKAISTVYFQEYTLLLTTTDTKFGDFPYNILEKV